MDRLTEKVENLKSTKVFFTQKFYKKKLCVSSLHFDNIKIEGFPKN